ncbi:uncharacterized protein LOC120351055 [Nilaparvata lugens]|uniref:uncharacterized protein LOC120351055 n=1 Tax=Nilaparvata lugens TaxID=108931 RepID=UPI00193D3853|nr:uncharacterized protein LOC120351055 [Nilaparvata lugens]
MPRRKSNLGRRTHNAEGLRRWRSNITEEEQTSLRERNRLNTIQTRNVDPAERRAARLEDARLRARQSRSAATDLVRFERNERERVRIAETRTERTADLHLEYNRLAFRYNPAIDYSSSQHVVIGQMSHVCSYCQALKFNNETKGMCCAGGKIKLPQLDAPPEPLKTLLTGSTAESKHFLSNIRKYNSCFQMTSFGAEIVTAQFMPTFKIKGQIYHKAGSLLPFSDSDHKFLQMYFIGDDRHEVDARCGIHNSLRRSIILQLQELLHERNSLVRLFKTAIDMMPSDTHKIVIHADKTPAGEHVRRYNAPTIDEVAIVIVGDQFQPRDIVLHRRNNQLINVAETHRCYDALQYPLIFWDGADGYHFNVKMINPVNGAEINKKCSSMNFYAYRLMIRMNEDNHILKFRQLFHQYLVDMYAKIETERLLFLRLNQTKLRSEEYIHLRDAVVNDGNTTNVGKLTILPSSFIGSPRHMQEYAQDAMSYVRHYGRPDLFITFTCNPVWDEIQQLLFPGQSHVDRHDIIARVFRQKLKSLMDFIVKLEVFGSVRCWMYSVEWQKRGLPHAHILIWLYNKITSDEIDDVICAEIPRADSDKDLHAVIIKNMIHGPCGTLNPNSPCMVDGKCSKQYPRAFTANTVTGDDGYPRYRRRSTEDGGNSATIHMRNGDIDVDNRWVVPYSPLLSKTYQAHINVEYCNSVKSIKYICKYVNKGSDMAVFSVQSDNCDNNAVRDIDEIAQYQAGRYISSNEAAWRIFSFPMHERNPAVVHLAVHLENGQRVYFTDANVQERALNPPGTTLTAFFTLCQEDAFARTLMYSEVPSYYTWNVTRKVFVRRKRGEPVNGHPGIFKENTIGRLYTVHPNQDECFYLRMLLVNVPGPTSFQQLKIVDGVTHATFRATCQALNLLENDQQWNICINDACNTAHPNQIRALFAIILTACFPSSPTELWERYRSHMAEDILHRVRLENANMTLEFTEAIYNEALINIEDKCLAIANKVLSQLGMPAPTRTATAAFDVDLRREQSYNINDLQAYVQSNIPKLTWEQKGIYDRIMQMINDGVGGTFFLDAPGGTGKTFLIRLILATVEELRIQL